MRSERLLLGILLSFAQPGLSDRSVAAAQNLVPKELALALVRGASDGGDILVGAMPPDLAADLPTPPGGRVLGSFVSASYVQVVIAMPGTADSALAYARRSLLQHGWQGWQPPSDPEGGLRFQPSASEAPTRFCRTGSMQPDALTVSASFYGYNTSLLRLTRTASGMCDPSTRMQAAQSRAGMMRMPFADVPPLYAPSGPGAAFAACRSSGGFRGRSSQSQPVQSTMAASEILTHYGRQLDSAGWRSRKDANTATAAGQWMKVDSAGTREVTITVSAIAARTGCYNVELSLAYD